MENFFYSDEYYSELGDLMEDLDIDEDNVNELPDDYALECRGSDLEPIFQLSAEWITERVNEERWPEDMDSICDQAYKAVNDNIDFAKVNSLIPKLYYPSRRKFTITKKDLIEYCN